ncbi:MAG: hypothetical protein M1438_05320 [Deltaproteobacteria bacterium]|nr:hypothetical protein [Deltaproteobacteria bacterium]
MPLYDYQCVDCKVQDTRIAGLDDQVALCIRCGGLMLRQDEDLFGPYFEEGQARELGSGSTFLLAAAEGKA